MDTLADRLKFLMARMEPQARPIDLANVCGIKPPSVQDWLNGRTKKLEGENLYRVSEFLKCNPIWLATGRGKIDADGEAAEVEVLDSPYSVQIPQFNTGGKMGDGFYLSQTAGVIESWRVSPEWLRANVPHCTSPKNLAIVTGLGDSMTGIFNNGDPVLVDRGVIQADHDGVYFFRVGCEGFIKRLQRIPGEGILVMSENKSYKEWYIRPADDFEVFGRVLKAWEGKGF